MKNLLALLPLLLFTNTGICDQPAESSGTPLPRLESLDGTGLTEGQLDDFSKHLKECSETTGMIVLFDGKIAFEFGDVQEVTCIASCRKSVLSMLYGKHVHSGKIDLGQEIGRLGIDEQDGLLPTEKQPTVDHLITSRSGVFHVPANGGYDEQNILERGSVEPGSYFVYNNWDFNVAGHVLA